jgi:hypothetical protein
VLTIRTDIETSFRRGFQHGVNYVLDGMQAGMTYEQLAEWANGPVTAFREFRTGTDVPPHPNDLGEQKP